MTVISFDRPDAFICERNLAILEETVPSSVACAFASLACVSKPPSDTDQIFVGDPAAINFATRFSCWLRFESPPAFPPATVGRSSANGAGCAKTGVILPDKLNKFRIDVAAAAINGLSFCDLAESRTQAFPI